MKSFFKELFEYSHHSNQRLWEAFMNNAELVSEKQVKLFSHILNAHQIWNNRIDPAQPTYGVWELYPLEDLKSIDQANYLHSLEVIEKFDLHLTINYSNTKGQSFSNTVRDILFHVINHSTYHRGQIATAFRQQGLEPIATDYIFYKR